MPDTMVDVFAKCLTAKIGRRVILSRYQIAGFKGISPTVWRYAIGFDGVIKPGDTNDKAPSVD